MPAPKPPPRTWKPDDERKVQLFLERAAPIVLEDPALTAQRWQHMAQIAAELELTSEQFRSTLDDLLNRGVIKRIDVSPPTPPPLPARNVSQMDNTVSDEVPELGFALSPPRPALPKRREKDARSDSPAVAREPFFAAPPAAAASAVSPSIPREMPRSTPGEAVSPSATSPSATDDRSAVSDRASMRWRVEGEPAPLPPPPLKKPHEIFREFLRKSLEFVAGGAVTEEVEMRLMAHGTRVLTLSQIYARHLLLEVATDMKLALASPAAQNAGTPETKAAEGANGTAQAANGTATDAVATYPATSESLTADRQQQERRVPFVDYVQRSVERLQLSVLIPQVLEQLVSTGVDFFGLEPDLAQGAIRDVATQRKATVITADEARRNLDDLIPKLLNEDFELAPEQQERLYQAASRWGFSRSQVDASVQQHREDSLRLRRREAIMTNTALAAAILAVVGVVVFLGYAFMGGRPRQPVVRTDSSQGEPPKSSQEKPAQKKTWLDPNLVFALTQARKAFPKLDDPLRNVTVDDPELRRAAYEQIVNHFLHDVSEDSRRQVLFEPLYRCLSSDPSDPCVSQTTSLLLAAIPAADAKLPNEPMDVAMMFWAVRTVSKALVDESTKRKRAIQLATRLGETLHIQLDVDASPESLEKTCNGAVAERVYHLLSSTAAESRDEAAKLHGVVMAEVDNYIDGPPLHRLNAKFLEIFLSAAPDSWRSFEELLRTTVAAVEPDDIVRLLDLYQATSNRELQDHLGGLLRERTSAPPEIQTVDAMIQHVRSELHLPEK